MENYQNFNGVQIIVNRKSQFWWKNSIQVRTLFSIMQDMCQVAVCFETS